MHLASCLGTQHCWDRPPRFIADSRVWCSPVYISYLVVLVLITGCLSFGYHYGQQKLA